MDTFMDKLASKLNAQEMIRANSAAEAAESDRLKQEVEAYKQCLEQMRQISSQNAANADEVAELVKACMDKIAAIQIESGKSDEVLTTMQTNSEAMLAEMKINSDAMLTEMKSSSNAMLNEMKNSSGAMLDEVKTNSDAMLNAVQNTMQAKTDAMVVEVQARNDELKESLKGEILAEIKKELKTQEENVHKECVKVYRNVQAVVTEENDKQTNAIVENQTKIRKRATAALVCGILAMSFSAVQLILSVLEITGVFDLLF